MTALRGGGPLALFLVAGLLLYLGLDAIGFGARDDQRIRVDRAALDTFLASRGGQRDGATLETLSGAERRDLLRDYLREEALYREARALGLDRGDTAIRRRMVQSLRFSLASEEDVSPSPDDKTLHAWFDAHRDRYRTSGAISFVHVFFDAAKRGRDAARADARAALRHVGEGDWMAEGDRFAYQRSYADLTRDTLAAQWGDAAAAELFAPAHAPGKWFGPVGSRWGFHLVRIDRRDAPAAPDFASQRAAVLADWRRDERDKRLRQSVNRIVATYPVTLSRDLDGLVR